MACEAINAWFNANQGINLLDCNIECCSGDKCNNHNLTLNILTTTTSPMNGNATLNTTTSPMDGNVTLSTTISPMDGNATGPGSTERPTTVAHGNNK